MTDFEIESASAALEGRDPAEVLEWAAGRFAPRIALGTGFGAEGCLLVHLIATCRLPIEMFTLDTGLLFTETYQLWRRVERHYGVRVRAVRPALSVEQQGREHGPALWRRDPDRCCALRKIAPLAAERAHLDAWVTAIRRDQTPQRASTRVLERDTVFGLVKVNPLAGWSRDDVWAFIRAHHIPYNALHDRGYPSIGCEPCTAPVPGGDDPRAGRWLGHEKIECGLHVRPAGRVIPLIPQPGP